MRWYLHNVDESEVKDANGYDWFEPSIELEIRGGNAFEALGVRKIHHVVVMHSRERWLEDTLIIIVHSGKAAGAREYMYPLYGTAYVLFARLVEEGVEISVEGNAGYGPLFGGNEGRYVVGTLLLREWVQSVAEVSRELSNLFWRLHPSLFSDSLFIRQETWLQELESWLAVSPDPGNETAEVESGGYLLARFRDVTSGPFPRPTTDDPGIWDIHGDLADWDSDIAGYMSRVVRKFEKGRRPLLRVRLKIPWFEKKIRKLLQEKPEHTAILLEYRKQYQRWIGFSELAEHLRRSLSK